MSLLKKIFGKKPADEASDRERAVRVNLSPLHRISFKTDSGLELAIANVSIGGMAVFFKSELDWQVAQHIKGYLHVGEKSFALRAQVRHIGGQFAGCQFMEAVPEVKEEIEAYLRGEILAMKLKRVSDIYMKPDPRGQVVWFTDQKQNEIYCVLDSKGLISFHISFLGNYLEGDLVKGVRAGTVRDHELKSGPAYKGSSLLRMDLQTPAETLRLARTIVEHVEGMPMQLRADLIRLLFRPRQS